MGSLLVVKPGLFTSIQDAGRFGYRRYGVPVSGAMDAHHAALANALLNNPADAPVLEITSKGPELHFRDHTMVAITGAELSASIDGHHMPVNSVRHIAAGQVLAFGQPQFGMRAYLGIKGGYLSETVMGSSSMYHPVTGRSRLETGDTLVFRESGGPDQLNAIVKPDLRFFQSQYIVATTGPEFEHLTPKQADHVRKGIFEIAENNRMGYQFRVSSILSHTTHIITSPVTPGTIQLTPSGRLIVLMRDGQVTGGYPRILQLAEDGMNRLAQKGTGQKIRFNLITLP